MAILPIGLSGGVVAVMLSILLIGYFVFKKQKGNTVEILVSEGNSLSKSAHRSKTFSFQEFEVEWGADSDLEFGSDRGAYTDGEKLLRGSLP